MPLDNVQRQLHLIKSLLCTVRPSSITVREYVYLLSQLQVSQLHVPTVNYVNSNIDVILTSIDVPPYSYIHYMAIR